MDLLIYIILMSLIVGGIVISVVILKTLDIKKRKRKYRLKK